MFMNEFNENEVKNVSLIARIGIFFLAAMQPILALTLAYFFKDRLDGDYIRLKLPVKCGAAIGILVLVFYCIVLLLYKLMN